MLPLIPFIAGAAAGVAATELWRRGKVQGAVQAASGKLRASAASGLESVRQSLGCFRIKLGSNRQGFIVVSG